MILNWHFLWVHIYDNLREGMEEDGGSKKKERKSQTKKKRWVGLLSLYNNAKLPGQQTKT